MKKNGHEDRPELISPDGISYGQAPADLPPRNDYLGPVKQTKVRFLCGHEGLTYQAISVYGKIITVSDRQAGQNLLCPDCIIKRDLHDLTRCAVCGGPIISGSKVVLYRDAQGFVADAKRIKHDGQTCVMGCGRCVPEGVRPDGEWNGERFVPSDTRRQQGLGLLIEALAGGGLPHPGDLGLCEMCDKPDCPDRKAPYVPQNAGALPSAGPHDRG